MPLPTRYASIEIWRKKAAELFGPDPRNWAFVCPSCGAVQTVGEMADSKHPQEEWAFSCIGRTTNPGREAFGANKEQPCNYAGGGLFRMNPVSVDDGSLSRKVFQFYEGDHDKG